MRYRLLVWFKRKAEYWPGNIASGEHENSSEKKGRFNYLSG